MGVGELTPRASARTHKQERVSRGHECPLAEVSEAEPLTAIRMRLSQKDKEFLERLKELLDRGVVWVDSTHEVVSRFVLRGNYGDRVESKFGLTRQGVRWRFFRLFNEIYVSAYTTILFIEKHLGTRFRQDALRIAQERFVARQQALENVSFKEANAYRGKNQD
mgnify:CR=1 FL=1